MKLYDQEGDIKGKEAEEMFRRWLKKHNIPNFYFKQDKESFSEVLRDIHDSKRPDFMILMPNIGFILVDVKYKVKYEYRKENLITLPIDVDDLTKLSYLQHNFNLPIWYALSGRDIDYKKWYFIPAVRVKELNLEPQTSGKSKEPFYSVPIDNYEEVDDSESIMSAFSKRFIFPNKK